MAFCLLLHVTGFLLLPKTEDFQNTNPVRVPSCILKLAKKESQIKYFFLKAKYFSFKFSGKATKLSEIL